MMMPNLDTVGHRWVAAMAGYNFEIKYVCGSDNKDKDAVNELLDQDAIKELLSHATRYGIP